jgi:hypothetical protein
VRRPRGSIIDVISDGGGKRADGREGQSSGPWPFITRCVRRHSDESQYVWLSRENRKRLISTGQSAHRGRVGSWLWAPGELNWWIGTLFALGAFLFATGCVISLTPALAQWVGLSATGVNAVFFAGSIPFTSAAYLQLFQAANAPADHLAREQAPHRRQFFGWRPKDIGWVSCALQFPGTVFFNFNTFDAMIPGLNWWQQELEIWVPNIMGSILFLASGYLAFIETCHRHLAWKPLELSWWVTLINLLGCIGFMIAAVFAVVLPNEANDTWVTLSIVFTLAGAVCFFVGSLLLLPENA